MLHKITMRTKITFESVNKDNYAIISRAEISEVNRRIRESMIPFLRLERRRVAQSLIDSRNDIKLSTAI